MQNSPFHWIYWMCNLWKIKQWEFLGCSPSSFFLLFIIDIYSWILDSQEGPEQSKKLLFSCGKGGWGGNCWIWNWSVLGLRERREVLPVQRLRDERRLLNFIMIPPGLYQQGCTSCRLELAGALSFLVLLLRMEQVPQVFVQSDIHILKWFRLPKILCIDSVLEHRTWLTSYLSKTSHFIAVR